MRILINEEEVNIPSSIQEITLGQRIKFQIEHGNELDAMIQSIIDMPDGFEKELESTQFRFEQMFRTFSFFSGVSIEVLKESMFIDRIASIYYANLAQINNEEADMELEHEHVWNEEVWEIQAPELKNGDRLTFGEFIDSKQIIQDLIRLGNSKWECLLPLCAIFLRKKNEKYSESFCYEGSDRLKLMETVPLNIAMQVGFFLTGSLTMFNQTSQYSPHPELNLMENI